MRLRAQICGVAVALAAAMPAGGCSAVTDLGAYKQGDGGTGNVTCAFQDSQPRDLVFHFEQFTPHINNMVQIRIVTTDSKPLLRGLAVFQPLGAADVTMKMPGAIPAGSHRLDVFADFDNNGVYTHPTTMSGFLDHSWQIEPCTPVTTFVHDVALFKDLPDPIPVGSDAVIQFTGMPANGQRFELHVIVAGTNQTVGFYRIPALNQSDFTVTIPGIIDTSLTYDVKFYSDTNKNDAYDPPPVDEAWEITGVTGGVSINFPYDSTTVTDIGF